MRERPILFSAPMVLALLAGRKTQTRRVVKPQPVWEPAREGYARGWAAQGRRKENSLKAWADERSFAHQLLQWGSPFGEDGDRLWVRETWTLGRGLRDIPRGDKRTFGPSMRGVRQPVIYRASGLWNDSDFTWKPSIFMPRWASRITLEVTGVRVERLQEIGEADAVAEGVTRAKGDLFGVEGSVEFCHHYPQDAYADLWRSINGDDSWKSNPWVWVVAFKRVESAKEAA